MGSPEESEPEPRSRSYRRLLFILLMPAALFNTYDSELRALLLTQIKGAFHVGVAALGIANIPIGAGQFIAFFVVLSADRIGRRPILLWSILGYTIFTSLTAVSWNLWSFATFQFFSQVFIGAEFGVAVTLLAEEVPPAERGRALAKLLLFSPVGAILGGHKND
jgi:putative MFS transporter